MEVTVCANKDDTYDWKKLKQFGITNYDKNWYGNSTVKTGNEIFYEVTFDLSKLIKVNSLIFNCWIFIFFVQEKIEVRTSHANWWFNPDNYTNKANADEKLLYNSTIPSPFKVLRNFYGGRCLAFSVPDFLWHEGIRRIGIFLQKPSFIRSLCI